MAVTIDTFLNSFPQFASATFIQEEIDNVTIETNGYCGFPTVALQDHAIKLHVAHNLTTKTRRSAVDPTGVSGGAVKKLRSREDEIEYHYRTTSSGNELDSTEFGQRLLEMCERLYSGGLQVQFSYLAYVGS